MFVCLFSIYLLSRKYLGTMAIAIKSIPTLKSKDAKDFVKKAKSTVKKRGTINFSTQVQATYAILKKADML